MNHIVSVALTALVSTTAAQDAIQWSKATEGELPKAAASDDRPTILYFTFDT